jgi:hypothetical protein
MKLPKAVLEYFREQGRIGAAKRIAEQSPEKRSEVARIAAQARWAQSKVNASQSTADSINNRKKTGAKASTKATRNR